MNKLNQSQQLHLAPGAVFSARFTSSQLLAIKCGHVWITQQGRSEDFWLSAGDSILVQPGQLVVIEAAIASDIGMEMQGAGSLRLWCQARIVAWLHSAARSGATASKKRGIS